MLGPEAKIARTRCGRFSPKRPKPEITFMPNLTKCKPISHVPNAYVRLVLVFEAQKFQGVSSKFQKSFISAFCHFKRPLAVFGFGFGSGTHGKISYACLCHIGCGRRPNY